MQLLLGKDLTRRFQWLRLEVTCFPCIKIALERARDEESTLQVRLGEMAICANQQFCEWILVSGCFWSCGRQVDSVLCLRMWVGRWFAQWTWTSAWFYGRSYQRSPKYHKKLDTLKMFDFNTFISLCCCDWLKNTGSFKPFFPQGLKLDMAPHLVLKKWSGQPKLVPLFRWVCSHHYRAIGVKPLYPNLWGWYHHGIPTAPRVETSPFSQALIVALQLIRDGLILKQTKPWFSAFQVDKWNYWPESDIRKSRLFDKSMARNFSSSSRGARPSSIHDLIRVQFLLSQLVKPTSHLPRWWLQAFRTQHCRNYHHDPPVLSCNWTLAPFVSSGCQRDPGHCHRHWSRRCSSLHPGDDAKQKKTDGLAEIRRSSAGSTGTARSSSLDKVWLPAKTSQLSFRVVRQKLRPRQLQRCWPSKAPSTRCNRGILCHNLWWSCTEIR